MSRSIDTHPNCSSASSRRFVATRQLDAGTPGGIFGIAIAHVAGQTSLVYANDNTVTLDVLPGTFAPSPRGR